MGRNVRDNLAPTAWERQMFAIPNEGHHNCARFALKPTSFQPKFENSANLCPSRPE